MLKVVGLLNLVAQDQILNWDSCFNIKNNLNLLFAVCTLQTCTHTHTYYLYIK